MKTAPTPKWIIAYGEAGDPESPPLPNTPSPGPETPKPPMPEPPPEVPTRPQVEPMIPERPAVAPQEVPTRPFEMKGGGGMGYVGLTW